MKNDKIISFRDVDLKSGFWQDRYFLNAKTSLKSVQKRFEETGRFDALRFKYDKNGKPLHVYYDSDVAKWMEAVAYLLEKDRAGMAEFEAFVDELVDCMAKNQMQDGYLNSYYQQLCPSNRFTDRNNHELYCAGHLIEAAIAYDKATGKHLFLQVMERYCDCINKVFCIDRSAPFTTPGHEEIELALMALYHYTGKKQYLDMAKFFIERRGAQDEQIIYVDNKLGAQDDTTVYDLKEANGHCVRAMYFYSGIADLALAQKDEKLLANLESVFTDVTTHKRYLTGGIGSTHRGEGFTRAYDLPNSTAYTESCAAISAVMFCQRMRKMNCDAKYGHYIEQLIYNAFLSSTSLDGKAFYYENPLEIALEEYGRELAAPSQDIERLPLTQRQEVFFCSCCPPNINRFVAKIGELVAVEGEDCAYLEQYISSDVQTKFGKISLTEEYATKGVATVSSENYTAKKLAIRVPEWCDCVTAILNGKEVAIKAEKDGYAYVEVDSKFSLALDFHIAPSFVSANPNVRANVGRVALVYGPVVYCLEGVENGARLNQISVSVDAVKTAKVEKDFHGLCSITMDGFRDNSAVTLYFRAEEGAKKQVQLRFIPYFAFANRGESDMLVWVRKA